MKIKNVLVVAGTRPEIIKLAPLIKELKRKKEFFEVTVLDSGQHSDISKDFWDIFKIKPDIQHFSWLGGINNFYSKFIKFINKVLRNRKIDIIVVQGDTTTAIVGALAGFNCKIPVVHLEAGLRTNNLNSPWPEEGNRRMIDEISSLLLCPTQNDVQNILIRRVQDNNQRVFLTGNTVVDAVKYIQKKNKKIPFTKTDNKMRILVTLHRRETQGKEMDALFCELGKLIEKRNDIIWHIIKHHNPIVKNSFDKYIKSSLKCCIHDSVPYDKFIRMMEEMDYIISDSGGIQEEATVLKTPVFLLRDYTERMEAVDSGWVNMIKTGNAKETFQRIELVLNIYDKHYLNKNNFKECPYGKGNAAKESVKAMIKCFCK